MSGELAEPLALDQIERIDRHAAAAWPALVEESVDGWTLRASGGDGGRRLNTTITPRRELLTEEIESGLECSAAFAKAHGIGQRLQVSPLHIHAGLVSGLDERGWSLGPEVQVMSGAVAQIVAGGPTASEQDFVVSREADEAWIAARARSNPGSDLASLRRTTLPLLSGRAHFCRIGERAAGIAVASDGLVALFALAVAPDARRQGLGKLLIRSMLAAVDAETVYLQVDVENVAGLALYRSLGFSEAYRYLHCVAPTRAAGA